MTRPSDPEVRAPQPADLELACRIARRAATDFLDGRLPAVDRDPIQAHLRGCTGCRSFYRDFVALGAQARLAVESMPAPDRGSLAERVLDEARRRRREVLRDLHDGLPIDSADPQLRVPAPPSRPTRVAAGVATWLSILVAAAALGGFLFGRWTAPRDTVVPESQEAPDADASLPGDPYRLRQRERDELLPEEIVVPGPRQDDAAAPTEPSEDDPRLRHVLTGDR